MITALPTDGIITTNGDYAPVKGYQPGREISIEVTGVFGGASVAIGFVSSDDDPVFIADAGDALTVPGRRRSTRPASGRPAVKVTSASGTTDLLIKIVDLPR